MSLEIASIPLAYIAGVLGIVSPCVWPLVPIVMTSAAGKGRTGPIFLAFGLSSAFAIAGSVLTYLLINAGLNPDAFREVAAVLLVAIGLILIIKPASDWIGLQLSLLSSKLNIGSPEAHSASGQFVVGMLLGLVWLPCVGPTLGAAIALAAVGKNMLMAFFTMLAFGLGTASALLVAAFLSGQLLRIWRPQLMANVGKAKIMLGVLLLLLGMLVLTEFDKALETYSLEYLPDWSLSL